MSSGRIIRNNKYGRCIKIFLTADRQDRPRALQDLYESIEEMVGKVTRMLGLTRVATEEQINNTFCHVIQEITTEPASFIQKNLTHKPPFSIKHSEFVRSQVLDFQMLAESDKLTEQEKLIAAENCLNRIQSYTYKRIRSLLKEYADRHGKDYILFNNRTRKNLKSLAAIDGSPGAFEVRPGFWSATKDAVDFCQNIKRILPLKLPADVSSFSIARGKYAESLRNFLTLEPHKGMAFSLRVISEFFFEILNSSNTNSGKSLIRQQHSYCDADLPEGEQDTDIIGQNDPGFELIAAVMEAEPTYEHLTRCYNDKDPEVQQILMAGLAYFAYIDYHANKNNSPNNSLFPVSPLRVSQLAKGLVDCVEDFLNDSRFNHLDNWKNPKRGTCNNRRTAFIEAVKNSISDMPHFAGRHFLQRLCGYLFDKFNCLTEGGS